MINISIFFYIRCLNTLLSILDSANNGIFSHSIIYFLVVKLINVHFESYNSHITINDILSLIENECRKYILYYMLYYLSRYNCHRGN